MVIVSSTRPVGIADATGKGRLTMVETRTLRFHLDKRGLFSCTVDPVADAGPHAHATVAERDGSRFLHQAPPGLQVSTFPRHDSQRSRFPIQYDLIRHRSLNLTPVRITGVCWKYLLAITLFVHLESPCNLWCQTVSFEDDMLPYFACCLALLTLSLASTRYRPVTLHALVLAVPRPSYLVFSTSWSCSYQHHLDKDNGIAIGELSLASSSGSSCPGLTTRGRRE